MIALIENIKEDYFNWTTRCGGRELSDINKTMIVRVYSKIRSRHPLVRTSIHLKD
jgi:ribosomal protein L20A (L18A)